MRIAVVNWSDRHVGGAETYIVQVLAGLADAGHDLVLWHEGSTPADRPAIVRPPDVSAIDGAADEALDSLEAWGPDVLFVQGLVDPACERRLLDIAPAALFAHGYYGTCITGSKTHTLPNTVPCDRRFGPACLAQFYPRRCGGLSPLTMWTEYRRQSNRLTNLSRYGAVLTFSEHMREEYRRHGIADHRLHRVDPIVPARRTTMRVARAERGHRLVFAGRLDALKGCRMLIECLPRAHGTVGAPIELVVAGSGPDERHCRTAADEIMSSCADVRIQFRGWLSGADLDVLVASSDLMVMPSLWPEPLGLSGIEAIALGVPVAAFRVGGIPEWLQDGVTGALAPGDPPTAEGLSTAIARVLLDPRIGESTRRRAAGWQPTPVAAHVAHLERIFNGVIGVTERVTVAVAR